MADSACEPQHMLAISQPVILQWNKDTYNVPEPESSFHFLFRSLHSWKRVFTYLEGHSLRLSNAFCIRVKYSRLIIQVGQGIQVHLRKHSKSSVHLRLEGQGDSNVQKVFPCSARVRT